MPREVRLRYAGALNYLAMIVRLIVSIGFITIITRKLTVEEFGLWAIISNLVSYPVILVSFWSYWCSGSVARNVPKSLGSVL